MCEDRSAGFVHRSYDITNRFGALRFIAEVVLSGILLSCMLWNSVGKTRGLQQNIEGLVHQGAYPRHQMMWCHQIHC